MAKLILWVSEQPDMEVVVGEVDRPDIVQEYYLKEGKTKVKHSKHQDSLAVDLALFVKGVYQTTTEAYKPLGDYWKSLHPENVWGGDWKSFHDGNHFQFGV